MKQENAPVGMTQFEFDTFHARFSILRNRIDVLISKTDHEENFGDTNCHDVFLVALLSSLIREAKFMKYDCNKITNMVKCLWNKE